MNEFSARIRQTALEAFARSEGDGGEFDFLVIGGGITGAAVARDAARRGLKVALVERRDFAWGTSSRSSKLIHGGLRYLENLEFKLVFEALSERSLLLKTAPHLVRPLPFYMPVYRDDAHGRGILSLGMWLYDLLALFRTPGFHRGLSARKMLREIPFLDGQGLKGGFRYYDASMWDDVMAVHVLRSAHEAGAQVANYVEAVQPIWIRDEEGPKVNSRGERLERIGGFEVRDQLDVTRAPIRLCAKRTLVCAGPWTDEVGVALAPSWRHWLKPSKGIHLVLDLKRLPVPGALVMSHPTDGRISFVIPRPDLGAGVVIVGTTDSPVSGAPERASIDPADIEYLMMLLSRYFPTLKLTASDILSAYVGVRPLFSVGEDRAREHAAARGESETAARALQKVSREHHVDRGPGGTVVVAGGKYTTHRRMAEEIVEYALETWREDAAAGRAPAPPRKLKPAHTRAPFDPQATAAEVARACEDWRKRGLAVPQELVERYGAAAEAVLALDAMPARASAPAPDPAPSGFPALEAQLRYCVRAEMVVHLTDFYFRRVPLFLSRADHGRPWAESLARVLVEERGLPESAIAEELRLLETEIVDRESWREKWRESQRADRVPMHSAPESRTPA